MHLLNFAYEAAADWRAAFTAAQHYAMDELGVRPARSAVALAVKRAQVRWANRRPQASFPTTARHLPQG